MTQVGEAIARYHKLIESGPYIDLGWAQALQEQLKAAKLGGRAISPVLRPHFLSGRDYAAMAKTAETISSAMARVEQMALATPALLARIQLLPAERMLAQVDPGYALVGVSGQLDTVLNNGSMKFSNHHADAPAGVLYGDMLADVYYEAPPVKEFRKKYKLKKLGGTKFLLSALIKSYKEFGGKQKKPRIAIVELKQPFAGGPGDFVQLAEFFTSEGYPDRGRFAGAARISQRRPAPRRIRDRYSVPPHSPAGIPGPLRSFASHGSRV